MKIVAMSIEFVFSSDISSNIEGMTDVIASRPDMAVIIISIRERATP
ncbi:MAG: hypothetical protein J6O03_09680 [Butyrivibrio sp.]|nr:hypothetical protein [Butyrivibrio sp.]MBO6197742.1 hypothetical protein [Butyrivibrio sp.]